MYTGPKLHNDQLVFGYDTGYGLDQHSSTRHYKGEPATNVIADNIPGYFGSGGETLYRSNYYGLNSDSGVFQRNFVSNPATANTSAFNNNAGLYKSFPNATLSSSTEYVLISFDFYMITPYVRHSSSSTGLNGYMGIRYTDGSTDNLGWNTSLNTPNAGDDWNNNSAYIGQWRKIALYVDLNDSKTPSFISAMYIYNDRTIKGEGIFTNFIITEHTTIPTGPVNYTSGTRSSTQSLIDLKKSTSIDVSNVSFDSTGQPTFDGTNDNISLADNFDLNDHFSDGGDFSIEAIIYMRESASQNGGVLTNQKYQSETDPAGFGLSIRSANTYGLNLTNSTPTSYQHLATIPFNVNNYHHIVYTFKSSTGNVVSYSNGSQYSNVTNGSYSWNIPTDSTRTYIGYNTQGGWGNYINMDIPVIKVYNKVITAQEVKQNYNAYKNRFNI